MPARWCRRTSSRIARRARASSTPRRCRSTRSSPRSPTAHAEGKDVARLHSGDLSVWSAMGEQLRRLRALGIPYHGHARRAVLCRGGRRARSRADAAGPCAIGGADAHARAAPARCRRARRLPPLPRPARCSRSISRCMCSTRSIAELTPHYGADCPGRRGLARELAGPAHRPRHARHARCRRSAPSSSAPRSSWSAGRWSAEDFDESRLYAADYDRRYRPVGAAPRFPEAS